MTLRARIAWLVAGAVAVTVLAVSVGAFLLVRNQLRGEVDERLTERAAQAVRGPGSLALEGPRPRRGLVRFGLDNAVQVIDASGNVVLAPPGTVQIPVTPRDRSVAIGGVQEPYLRDVRVDGEHLRVITLHLRRGYALQIARSLEEVDGALRGMAVVFVILTALGVAGAAGVGLLVARGALAPVERLTDAAEHVARTKELDAAIDVDGDDELGRLGRSFNEMLQALGESREQQRRLVADASHELRTPLTSIRTNVELLARQPTMKAAERKRVLEDVQAELEEVSALVGELVALATETRDADAEEIVEVRLDEIVSSAVERARRRTGREISVDADESLVRGRPLALERAVANILDNACKWGPADEPIDVKVESGSVEVRDRGPGIDAEDRAHVFDRFYRATSARSMPGSGLGLAIVKQIAQSHGGRVWVDAADGPGAVIGFELPVVTGEDPSPDS